MNTTRTLALAGTFALALATLSTGAMAQSAGGGGSSGGGGGGGGEIQSSIVPPTTHAVPGGQTHGRGGAAPTARTIREACHFDRNGFLILCERQVRR